uniref:Transcriptional regulator, MarR family n=1 Tax=Deinococcus radiodurans TaxID=1299 RepID=UPI0006AD09BA|nr:Chain A, Transcriptional regulator, MarR family [Deinococcus radiodurans]5DD8_B Chain B, Transcriptional regulator, MarR family [Deinococcus radiodurans]
MSARMDNDTAALLERIRSDWARLNHGQGPDSDGLTPSAGPMLTLLLLQRLHAALGREIERTYAASGLNAAGWDLLLTLYRSAPPEGLRPTELSALAAISGPSTSNRIVRLLEKGLIERREDERDRRSASIRLTPQGRALVTHLLPAHLATTQRVLAPLSAQEQRTLEELAGRMLAGLEQGV